MIRRILIASAGAIALSGAAFAADLPVRAPPPVYLPPPPPLWTGFYVGLNAGGTWTSGSSIATSAFNLQSFPAGGGLAAANASILGATAFLPANFAGFIGGGQIGYNFQFGPSWVAGIEADIQGVAGASGTSSLAVVTPIAGFPANSIGTNLTASKGLDYLGTVRGRFGFLVTPTLLVYGDGGFAYGGVSSTTSIFQVINGPTAGITTAFGTTGTLSTTRIGWTAGGGLEWLFTPNWSAKVEYLYYDLGRAIYNTGNLASVLTVAPGGPFFNNATQSAARFNGHIVRAGINYHFNWGYPAPVVAKY